MNKTASKLSLSEIYRCLYPWRSIDEFVSQLQSSIAYKSPDNSLVALNKPFGVGTYTVLDTNTKKQNPDKSLSGLSGHPKYCLSDALEPLSDILGSPKKYEIIKGIDRYCSGLVLITNNDDHVNNFRRATAASRIHKWPPFGFRAITNGYPTLSSDKIHETVGVERVEIDELGDHKEPIISANKGSTYRRNPNRKAIQAELIVKKVNKELSCSMVELYTSNLGWDFTRLYISSKTAFILGDVRFSRRIKKVLGKRIQLSGYQSTARYDDSYEPLDEMLSSALQVKKNNQIPLMLDHHCLRLKYFDKKTKEDLLIVSEHTPLHFLATGQCLGLL